MTREKAEQSKGLISDSVFEELMSDYEKPEDSRGSLQLPLASCRQPGNATLGPKSHRNSGLRVAAITGRTMPFRCPARREPMTSKVPPILFAVAFAVSAFSVTLVVPSAEAEPGGCLRIEMGGEDYGVFHNRCDVGLFVIWNDEGACSPRDTMDWYPCSHWVPPLGTAGTGPELAGRVTWLACENDYPRETGNGDAVCEGGAEGGGGQQGRADQISPNPSVPDEASEASRPRESTGGGLAGRWIKYNESAASLHEELLRTCGYGTHNEFTENDGKIYTSVVSDSAVLYEDELVDWSVMSVGSDRITFKDGWGDIWHYDRCR